MSCRAAAQPPSARARAGARAAERVRAAAAPARADRLADLAAKAVAAAAAVEAPTPVRVLDLSTPEVDEEATAMGSAFSSVVRPTPTRGLEVKPPATLRPNDAEPNVVGRLQSVLADVDTLTRERDDVRAQLSAAVSELGTAKRRIAELEQELEVATKVPSPEPGQKRQANELAQTQRALRNLAYTGILSLVPTVANDRVLVNYTNPPGLLAVGAVVPRPAEGNSAGVHIRGAVAEYDGDNIESVVPPEACTPIDRHNVDDVVRLVMAEENVARMKRAKGKHESGPVFRARVLKETVAELKASNTLAKHTHLVDAAAALVILAPEGAASR